MHNIDTRYAAATRPAVKPAVVANGWFGEGNSAIGQRATEVSADWLNDVQGALLSVLDSAEVEPEKGSPSVFLTALEKVIENKISNLFLTKYKKVGSIEIRYDESNPADEFGGNWVLMPAGYTLVNLDSGDPTLDEIGKMRGSKTVSLTGEQNGAHTHEFTFYDPDDVTPTRPAGTGAGSSPTPTATTASSGSGAAHENMQPSIVVRIWRRTA